MASLWYTQIDGAPQGPFTSRQLYELARAGKLAPDGLVRKGDQGRWTRAGLVRGLFPECVRPTSWYCQARGRHFGPVTEEQIRRAIAAGKLLPDDLVRCGADGPWVPVARSEQLLSTASHEQLSLPPPNPLVPEEKGTVLHSDRNGMHITTWPQWLSAMLHGNQGRALVLIACTLVPFLLPTFGTALAVPGVWLMAAAATVAGWVVLRHFYRPGLDRRGWAIGALLFTLVFGATTLVQFADFAASLVDREVPWQNAPLWLVKRIGMAYAQANTVPAGGPSLLGFLGALGSAVVSVGLCEELLKLLPVAVGIGTRSLVRRQDAMFVGAAAGFGFGLAEALWISFDAYLPGGCVFSTYLTRFVGCAFAHAAISALGTALLLVLDARLTRWQMGSVARGAAGTVAVAAILAVPHGFYNVCLSHGLRGLAGLTIALVVWCLASWKPAA